MRRHPIRRVWERLQETPEMTISGLIFTVAVIALAFEWPHLNWRALLLYFTLGIGGGTVLVGRYLEDVDIESAGLALLCAALVFVFARQLPDALKLRPVHLALEAVIGLVLNDVALIALFGIRLYVVRRAARAQRIAAKINARKRGD